MFVLCLWLICWTSYCLCCFWSLFCCLRVNVSTRSWMLANRLFPFLKTNSLPMSSLGCKVLCIVMSFLVFLSICLSSSLVHFKNGPEYLMSRTALIFIPLMRFLIYSLVLSSFLVIRRYFLKHFFFHTRLFDGVRFQFFPPNCALLFSECSDFSWFDCSLPCVICRFLLFVISVAHFPMPNSIPITWLYILTAYIRVTNAFSFLANSLMLSMYIRWLIFSCDL